MTQRVSSESRLQWPRAPTAWEGEAKPLSHPEAVEPLTAGRVRTRRRCRRCSRAAALRRGRWRGRPGPGGMIPPAGGRRPPGPPAPPLLPQRCPAAASCGARRSSPCANRTARRFTWHAPCTPDLPNSSPQLHETLARASVGACSKSNPVHSGKGVELPRCSLAWAVALVPGALTDWAAVLAGQQGGPPLRVREQYVGRTFGRSGRWHTCPPPSRLR